MLAALALCICFLSIFFYQRIKSGKFEHLEKYPGPKKFPFIGNLWFFSNYQTLLTDALRLQHLYGNRVYMTGCGKRFLHLFHPDDVRKILTTRKLNRSYLYDLIYKDWAGSSSFTAKENEHLIKRKMIRPAFDAKRVDDFEGNLNENAKMLVKRLRDKEVKGHYVEIQGLLRTCSLNISRQYVVGKDENSLENLDDGYAEAVHKELQYVSYRAVSPWLWPEFLWKFSPTGRREKLSRKILHDTMNKIIEDRKANSFAQQTLTESSFEESNGPIQDKGKLKLLDLLILQQQVEEPGVTNKYIRDEANFVLFVAHDSATSATTFALNLIASHPEDQAKVQKELDEVLGDDKEGNIRFFDLGKLEYLECCIKESLRLYPPAPSMSRRTDEDFQLDKDLLIPKNVEILISPWVTHRLAEFFPHPEKFMPSRFFPDNSIGRHPYCYIPFSAGSRSCLGQKIAIDQIKMVLAHIFHNFTVELAPGAEVIKPHGDFVLSLESGLQIKLTSR